MMNAIEIDKLLVRRGNRTILDGISLKVEKGEIFALLGGNGAGKSTTLLSLIGLLQPESGRATILGESVEGATRQVRRNIAYLPESASLYNHLDAYENLRYFMALSGVERTREEVDLALDKVGLQVEARSRTLQAYSKGMRQKTAIALALLREAPVLLLDEPTTGLDPLAIGEFNRLMQRLAEGGCTIMLVTHDLFGACQVADHIALLRDGRVMGEFHAEPGSKIDLDKVLRAFTLEAAA